MIMSSLHNPEQKYNLFPNIGVGRKNDGKCILVL